MPTPYEVICQCGRQLTITYRSMDSDGDVTVGVEPCNKCLIKAENEAEERVRSELS